MVTAKKQLRLGKADWALIKFLFNIFPMINDPTASCFGPELIHKIFSA